MDVPEAASPLLLDPLRPPDRYRSRNHNFRRWHLHLRCPRLDFGWQFQSSFQRKLMGIWSKRGEFEHILGGPTILEVWNRSKDYTVGVECLGFTDIPCRVTMGEQVDFRVGKVARGNGGVQSLSEGVLGRHR